MTVERLSSVFGALADPTRRAILARLVEGDLAVRDVAAPFSISQPAISRHLKVLEGAGLISRSRRATARLSHLEPESLRDATTWIARYQALWDERFDLLDEVLVSLQEQAPATRKPDRPAGKAPKAPRKSRNQQAKR